MEIREQVRRIQNGDGKAFEKLFFTYYQRLCGFAVKIVKSPDLARDCVQEVFLKIWRNRDQWEINHSLSTYLYQSVRNQALNILEKQKNKREYTQKYYEQDFHKGRDEDRLSDQQRSRVKAVWEAAETMPGRRKMVFELHRRHGLSYKEIACVMDISRKTVENHMGMALQDIRDKLACQKG
ncbi:MAG TPA: RNA polymerase sigma-70 factor [Fodinibius sp.]|nr:RNA polymerase sigma-70 factor [Fodinibius sp.]